MKNVGAWRVDCIGKHLIQSIYTSKLGAGWSILCVHPICHLRQLQPNYPSISSPLATYEVGKFVGENLVITGRTGIWRSVLVCWNWEVNPFAAACWWIFGQRAINHGSFRPVGGYERENSRKTRDGFGRIRECALQSPLSPAPDDSLVEPDPPGQWPLCKLTPIWNWPKVPPTSAVSKTGSS